MYCPSEQLVKAAKTGKPMSLDVLANIASDDAHCSRVHLFRTDISGKRNRSNAHLAFFDFLRKAPLLETHGEIRLKNEKGHTKTLRGIMNPHEWDMDTVEQPLLLAHACCWKLARKLQPNFSPSHFYRLMRQLHPILPRNVHVNNEHWRLVSLSRLAALCPCIAKDSLGLEGLLKRLVGLPRELQQMIWRNVPANCLTFSLLAAAESVAVASDSAAELSVTNPIFSHESLIPERLSGRGWLQLTFIFILGRRYVQRIHVSKAQPSSKSDALEIDIREVSHLHFTVEEIGISAIQIVYKDGTESDWLGDPEGGWRGSTLGSHLTDLQVWQDDLKVLSLIPRVNNSESSVGHGRPSRTFASRELWNLCPNRSAGDELRMEQLGASHVPLMHHPDWSLRQYLPFYRGGRHATGMTVYLDFSGTMGVAVHWHRHTYGVGTRKGLSMHIPFGNGEKIIGLDLLRLETNNRQEGPFLLIETELNDPSSEDATRRSVFFGPPTTFFYFSYAAISRLPLLQGQGQGAQSLLRGLIVDPLTLRNGTYFTTIGAHVTPMEEGKNNNVAQDLPSTSIRPIMFPNIGGLSNIGGCKTIAKLLNVKEIAVQKTPQGAQTRRPRCIGLFICYTDGSNAVLGQWDVSASSTIIYDAAKGELLSSLLFQRDPPVQPCDESYMVDVVANVSREAYHARKLEEEEDRYSEPLSKGSVFEWLATSSCFQTSGELGGLPIYSESQDVCWSFGLTFDDVRYCGLRGFHFPPDERSGKSTIGKLVANALSREQYSLDRHREELYAPYGYDRTLAEKIYEEQGLWAFYQHWKPFEYKTVSHILQNAKQEGDVFYGKILDFGAGHSVFEDPDELAHIEALMEPYENVFLVVPCEDVDEVVRITEERRGHELGLNRHFVEHPSNRRLAKHIIYTKDMTAEESAKEVLCIIRSRQENGRVSS
ncbi:hypothetical protein V8C44DRAFT_364785 [Trichoderma aethiopicum]